MISFKQTGDFSNLTKFLERAKTPIHKSILDKCGQSGVDALRAATPVESGETADSWKYRVTVEKDYASISFENSNVQDGVPIAIILQYGHGTGTGGWVEGRDYINPAIQPIFDEIADSAWKEASKT